VASNSIEQAIYTFLNASTAVTGTGLATGAYFMQAPTTQATPYVTFSNVDAENLSLSFESGTGSNDSQPLTQIDIWSDDRYKGIDISDGIISELNRFNGSMDGIHIVNIECRGPRQLRDPDYENMYHYILEADIEYTRP